MDAPALLDAVRDARDEVRRERYTPVEIRVGPSAYRMLRAHAEDVTGGRCPGEIRYYGLPLRSGDDLDAFAVTVKGRRA
jgi:hypothetical protein